MRLWLKNHTENKLDIKRSYGSQTDGNNCFALCLQYLSEIAGGFDFENQQVWKFDSKEKLEKTSAEP